ncbi:MAG: hypothetical protein HLX46_13040 [Corynebacterium sp.]|nr:hypothetical protein [Corynebacterium sp.]NWO17712.1 hypothetical protein [Corynebacterium sp.]
MFEREEKRKEINGNKLALRQLTMLAAGWLAGWLARRWLRELDAGNLDQYNQWHVTLKGKKEKKKKKKTTTRTRNEQLAAPRRRRCIDRRIRKRNLSWNWNCRPDPPSQTCRPTIPKEPATNHHHHLHPIQYPKG